MIKYIKGRYDDIRVPCCCCNKVIEVLEDCWGEESKYLFICLRCAPTKEDVEIVYHISVLL